MMPTQRTKLRRASACRSDLLDNGIDADALGPRGLADLARWNLEYFQSMLGYDAGPREVVLLMYRRGKGRAQLARKLFLSPEHKARELLHGITFATLCIKDKRSTLAQRHRWRQRVATSRRRLESLYSHGLDRNFRDPPAAARRGGKAGARAAR